MVWSLAWLVKPAFGQEGLGFAGQEVVQDQRTALTLFPKKPLCITGNFEMSFDLAFFPNQKDYFGYILRLIDDDNQNIDLIYDRDAAEKHFRIIIGERFSSIAFDIPKEKLFNGWTKISLKFDQLHHQLWLYCNGMTFKEGVDFKEKNCYQVNFGLSSYKHFRSTDVPAMKLRDIRISKDNRPLFYWPLNENNGLIAHDRIKEAEATVINPLWGNKLHYEWQHLRTLQAKGPTSTAFDPRTESIYLVGTDTLWVFSVKNSSMVTRPYTSGHLFVADGNQSIYDTLRNKLLNLDVDQGIVAVFDTVHASWNQNYHYPADKTDHGHSNKFISALDSNLYVMGGYGHFFYKHDINRYVFAQQRWDTINAQHQELYTPRYLAALGATPTVAYIIGGYGSYSGKQMLNPRNFYDLLCFDLKSKTFTRQYELKVNGDDFVFANSLVLDTSDQSYYGLIFPRHKFKSNLRLIKGSLEKPVYTYVGNAIAFNFLDSRSDADLFYCPSSKRFVAVTSYRDDRDITHIALYTLYWPPLTAPLPMEQKKESQGWLIVAMCLFSIGLGLAYVLWKNSKAQQIDKHPVAIPISPSTVVQDPVKLDEETVNDNETIAGEQIYLFGELSVINEEGEDISKHFTPLLKELFLVILLYSLRRGKGINSDKLIELLWFDKSEESARNNRSANIAKLKHILDKYSHIKLVKEASNWKIVVEDIYVDYRHYMELIKQPVTKETISALSKIVKRGGFLGTIEYQWLDPFKSEVANDIVSIYLQFIQHLPISLHAEWIIRLANELFFFDPVNEEAVILKCRALVCLGQHSQAAHTFENFCKEYEALYGQVYAKDFRTIINN